MTDLEYLLKKKNRSLEDLEFLFIEAGVDIISIDNYVVWFWFKGHKVQYWIKKEWASGRSITDCRGLETLIKQLTK